jgi:hypothetical protein
MTATPVLLAVAITETLLVRVSSHKRTRRPGETAMPFGSPRRSTVATTVLLAVAITETLALSVLVTYTKA